MDGREVIRRAVHFARPDRMPVMFESLAIDDTAWASWNQTGSGNRASAVSFDEWGCGWVRTEVPNMGQVKVHPLEAWTSLSRYRYPDPDDPAFYAGIERTLDGKEGKYVLTGIFMLLFERMHSLRGLENVLVDLHTETALVEALADRIVEFDIAVMRNIAQRLPGRVHGLFFTDDWGDERSLLVSPAMWRRFFAPRYRRVFDACRALGWDVWMHSCGRINDIIEDLIGLGVQVLNVQQPRLLGIEEIGRRFAGRICFQTSCDIQHTLPQGAEGEVRDEAKRLVRSWSTDAGGFILADDRDNDNVMGVSMEARKLMFDAFMAEDRWRR